MNGVKCRVKEVCACSRGHVDWAYCLSHKKRGIYKRKLGKILGINPNAIGSLADTIPQS